MSKYLGLKIFLCFFILSNFVQTKLYGYALKNSYNAILLIVLIGLLLNIYKNRKVIKLFFINNYFNSIPKGLKVISVVVLLGQLYCLTFGKTYYPFADVGMFRSASHKVENTSIYTKPTYYINTDNELKLIQLRKLHTFLNWNMLDWRYNNEYTFSAAYHYKSYPENFLFIKNSLMEDNIISDTDTVFIGLETVNFRTKEISFDSDVKKTINFINKSESYYGKLYIPKEVK